MRARAQLIVSAMLAALTVFGVLNLDTVRVSAAEFPAIYISPPYVSTEEPWSAIGTNYTFFVHTDYNGSDVFCFQFYLTYNPHVLEGVAVVNGDLITDDTLWLPGDFNNTPGELELTGSRFFSLDEPPPMTSGPGIMANVTFTVVGYGISNVTFSDEYLKPTRLIGWGGASYYDIIDSSFPHKGVVEGGVLHARACAHKEIKLP